MLSLWKKSSEAPGCWQLLSFERKQKKSNNFTQNQIYRSFQYLPVTLFLLPNLLLLLPKFPSILLLPPPLAPLESLLPPPSLTCLHISTPLPLPTSDLLIPFLFSLFPFLLKFLTLNLYVPFSFPSPFPSFLLSSLPLLLSLLLLSPFPLPTSLLLSLFPFPSFKSDNYFLCSHLFSFALRQWSREIASYS